MRQFSGLSYLVIKAKDTAPDVISYRGTWHALSSKSWLSPSKITISFLTCEKQVLYHLGEYSKNERLGLLRVSDIGSSSVWGNSTASSLLVGPNRVENIFHKGGSNCIVLGWVGLQGNSNSTVFIEMWLKWLPQLHWINNRSYSVFWGCEPLFYSLSAGTEVC